MGLDGMSSEDEDPQSANQRIRRRCPTPHAIWELFLAALHLMLRCLGPCLLCFSLGLYSLMGIAWGVHLAQYLSDLMEWDDGCFGDTTFPSIPVVNESPVGQSCGCRRRGEMKGFYCWRRHQQSTTVKKL